MNYIFIIPYTIIIRDMYVEKLFLFFCHVCVPLLLPLAKLSFCKIVSIKENKKMYITTPYIFLLRRFRKVFLKWIQKGSVTKLRRNCNK